MTARTPDTTSLTAWVADAVQAPSTHNAQPWLFHYERARGALALRMDPTRTMPRSDPSTRGLHLGCGAALFNLRVAAADAGWEARITARPDPADPELPAVAGFVPARDRDDIAGLRPAVLRRHTSRVPFSDEPVPEELLDGLRGAAVGEGARLDVADDWRVWEVLTAVWDAERAEELSPEVRDEIARWTADRDASAPDGIPPYARGLRRHDGRAPVRDFPGGGAGDRGAAVYEPAPCLAVLGTRRDEPEDWLRRSGHAARTAPGDAGRPGHVAELAGAGVARAALARAGPALADGTPADRDPPRLRPRGTGDAPQSGVRGPDRRVTARAVPAGGGDPPDPVGDRPGGRRAGRGAEATRGARGAYPAGEA